MSNKKFFYDTRTLSYERVHTPFKQVFLRYLGLFFAFFCTSIIFTIIIWNVWEVPRVRIRNMSIENITAKYEVLSSMIDKLEHDMKGLEQRDNEIYRTIFQAPLVSDSVRKGDKLKIKYDQDLSRDALFEEVEVRAYILRNRLEYQKKSYIEIQKLVKNKEFLLKATPSIQPINNKNLNRIASGFGYRIDPIYKTQKFHEGLDFSAPEGTPIYATAEGRIIKREFNAGYGNHIVIDHGYGYQTLYGHMHSYNVKIGQHVYRGEVIGFVGNTGKSVGPHCHYEVIKNHVKVDPVYYFYSDLTPEQFETIVRLAQEKNQSID